MSDFKVGDRVSIEATVTDVNADGSVIRLNIAEYLHPVYFYKDRLTLVSRPKRTVTLELDEEVVEEFVDFYDGIYVDSNGTLNTGSKLEALVREIKNAR